MTDPYIDIKIASTLAIGWVVGWGALAFALNAPGLMIVMSLGLVAYVLYVIWQS